MSRFQSSTRRNVISIVYLAALVVAFLVGAFANTYGVWVGFGVLFFVMLLGAIPLGLLLLFTPTKGAPPEPVGRKPVFAIVLLSLTVPAIVILLLFGALFGSSR